MLQKLHGRFLLEFVVSGDRTPASKGMWLLSCSRIFTATPTRNNYYWLEITIATVQEYSCTFSEAENRRLDAVCSKDGDSDSNGKKILCS